MNWASWGEFLAMGGYALYVWGSYAVCAGLMVLELTLLVSRRAGMLRRLGRKANVSS